MVAGYTRTRTESGVLVAHATTHLREICKIVEVLDGKYFSPALRLGVLDRHQARHGEARVVAPHSRCDLKEALARGGGGGAVHTRLVFGKDAAKEVVAIIFSITNKDT